MMTRRGGARMGVRSQDGIDHQATGARSQSSQGRGPALSHRYCRRAHEQRSWYHTPRSWQAADTEDDAEDGAPACGRAAGGPAGRRAGRRAGGRGGVGGRHAGRASRRAVTRACGTCGPSSGPAGGPSRGRARADRRASRRMSSARPPCAPRKRLFPPALESRLPRAMPRLAALPLRRSFGPKSAWFPPLGDVSLPSQLIIFN